MRELDESAARTLGTTPAELDAAWKRAELSTARHLLERNGMALQLPATQERFDELDVSSRAIALPDPRYGGLKQLGSAPVVSSSTPSVIPTWDVGQAKYPRQSYANWIEEGYRKNEIAFACVRELAQSTSEPRLRVKLSDEPEAPFVDDHPAALFMRQPRERTSQSSWMSEFITLGAVGGNTLAWKERSDGNRVLALRWLRSDKVKLIRRADGTITDYRYNNGTSEVDLPAEDVVHYPWAFDPAAPGWGLSPFAVLARAVSTDNVVTDWQHRFFEQAAVPYGLITTEQMLLPDDADRMAERWQERYSGLDGWHRPAVLGQGAKYERMGLNMQEMALDTLRSIDESRICAVFNVPAILAGAKVGLDRSTFANYAEARRSFWSETLRPLYRQVADALTLQLAPDFGSTVRFEFDLSDVAALQVDEGEKWTRAGTAFVQGWVSDNEARQEIGLDPWPIARRMLTVAQVPEPAPAPSDQSGSVTTAARAHTTQLKHAVPVETKASAGDALQRALSASQRSLVPPFETRMRQLYRAIATHASENARKASTRAELKQLPSVADLLDESDRDELELELRRFRDLVGEQTTELLKGLYPLDGSYDPPPAYYARVSADTRAMWETLQARLAERLAVAEERGWSDDQLVNGDDDEAGVVAAIAGTSADDRRGTHVLTAATALIALDQYVSHRNDASVTLYGQAGVSFVDVEDGVDHDEACAAADGQRWSLDEALANEKEHPNCVRVFVPVFELGG